VVTRDLCPSSRRRALVIVAVVVLAAILAAVAILAARTVFSYAGSSRLLAAAVPEDLAGAEDR